MPLTQEQEDADYQLRIQQMQTNIEKLRSDIRYEGRKFFVQALVGVAVSLGAGVALANYVNSRPQPAPLPPPAPTIIIIPAPASPGHT